MKSEPKMKFLLTNDDGIHAAGLRAMERMLLNAGHEVFCCAPSGEMSGVSRSITFLTPLFATKSFDGPRLRGYAIDGTPTDCVKLGLFRLCPFKPDAVLSGINGGLNAGINIHYSGTVGGAYEGAISGIPSFAMSLEYDDNADYDTAAEILWNLLTPILAKHQKDHSAGLYNLNVPESALGEFLAGNESTVTVCPMEVRRAGMNFKTGHCPKNRSYYWATHDNLPPQTEPITDVYALEKGHLTITPLEIDLTKNEKLDKLMELEIKSIS